MAPKAISGLSTLEQKRKNHASDFLRKWTITIVYRERIFFKESTLLMQNNPTYMVEAPALLPIMTVCCSPREAPMSNVAAEAVIHRSIAASSSWRR
jgi:hypothetical protein